MRNQYAKALLSSVASDRKIYQPPVHNNALSIITLHPFSITPQGHPVLPVWELPPPLYTEGGLQPLLTGRFH